MKREKYLDYILRNLETLSEQKLEKIYKYIKADVDKNQQRLVNKEYFDPSFEEEVRKARAKKIQEENDNKKNRRTL